MRRLLLSVPLFGACLVPALAFASADVQITSGGVTSLEAWKAVLTVGGLAALLTLTALETVLGIDNIVFISIVTSRLPASDRPKARRLGLMIAMVSRILLLLTLGWLMRLTEDLFQVPKINADSGISGKDLILIIGGAFLLVKAVREIHHKVEGHDEAMSAHAAPASFGGVLVQVGLIDIIFSLDSVITAVGMTPNIPVMIIAVITSVLIMLFAAGPISNFVERHPAVKILALSFLVLIGVLLIAEGFGQHISKGYVYFAMAFALAVEMLQIRMHARTTARGVVQSV